MLKDISVAVEVAVAVYTLCVQKKTTKQESFVSAPVIHLHFAVLGSGSSVLAQSAESIPEILDIETARSICLSNFGEAYVGQFSEAVFHEHAVGGALARSDFLKLVQTEADSSLEAVWEVNTSNAGRKKRVGKKGTFGKKPTPAIHHGGAVSGKGYTFDKTDPRNETPGHHGTHARPWS